jgi:hypothetical protein
MPRSSLSVSTWQPQVIDVNWLTARRDGKVDARVFQHPFGVVGLLYSRSAVEELRIVLHDDLTHPI